MHCWCCIKLIQLCITFTVDIDVYFQFTQTVSHFIQCIVPTSHFVKWLHQIVFRHALLLLNECGCGDYSVLHKCIIYLSILHAFLVLFLVPATPTHLNVCAVYDMVNETLQIIESSWNKVVCHVCKEWSPALITFKLVLIAMSESRIHKPCTPSRATVRFYFLH